VIGDQGSGIGDRGSLVIVHQNDLIDLTDLRSILLRSKKKTAVKMIRGLCGDAGTRTRVRDSKPSGYYMLVRPLNLAVGSADRQATQSQTD
jgi:hypothetical protein